MYMAWVQPRGNTQAGPPAMIRVAVGSPFQASQPQANTSAVFMRVYRAGAALVEKCTGSPSSGGVGGVQNLFGLIA